MRVFIADIHRDDSYYKRKEQFINKEVDLMSIASLKSNSRVKGYSCCACEIIGGGWHSFYAVRFRLEE